jgi:hypothetical protein
MYLINHRSKDNLSGNSFVWLTEHLLCRFPSQTLWSPQPSRTNRNQYTIHLAKHLVILRRSALPLRHGSTLSKSSPVSTPWNTSRNISQHAPTHTTSSLDSRYPSMIRTCVQALLLQELRHLVTRLSEPAIYDPRRRSSPTPMEWCDVFRDLCHLL